MLHAKLGFSQNLFCEYGRKSLRVFLPEDKRADFKELGLHLLRSPNLVLAQKFLGKTIFAWRAVPLGRLHIRPLQLTVIKALRSGCLILENEAKMAVKWWTHTPDDGVELQTPPTVLSMTTDALASGWRVTLDHRSVSEVWTDREAGLHNNHLELLAVMRAVQAFILILRNKGIDNVTAASYLSKEGGMRSASLNELTRDILGYCSRHSVILVSANIPGVQTWQQMETREWLLYPVVTRRIFQRLCTPEVDLFASSRSAQVRPGPELIYKAL